MNNRKFSEEEKEMFLHVLQMVEGYKKSKLFLRKSTSRIVNEEYQFNKWLFLNLQVCSPEYADNIEEWKKELQG